MLRSDSSRMLKSWEGEELRNDDSLQLVGTVDQVGDNVGLLDDVIQHFQNWDGLSSGSWRSPHCGQGSIPGQGTRGFSEDFV